MKTQHLIDLAGGKTRGREVLALLLGIKPIATYKWGATVPDRHIWKLQVLRPEWFKEKQK